MPKMKTNRAARKRFKPTSSGKLKRAKAFRNHILTKKAKKRKKNLGKTGYVHPTDAKNIMQLI